MSMDRILNKILNSQIRDLDNTALYGLLGVKDEEDIGKSGRFPGKPRGMFWKYRTATNQIRTIYGRNAQLYPRYTQDKLEMRNSSLE